MKKLFLAMLIGAVALVGCSKDDGGNEGGDPLVTNVTLPAAGTSFASGETVTITGNGFTASDAILFRVPTKATAPTTDIRATIITVTATELTFEVPEGLPAGENSVILKRGASEMTLGKISIEAEEPTPGPEPQTAILYGFGIKDNHTVVYRIDAENGALTEIAALQDGEYLSGAVTIPGSGMIFGIAREEAWGAGAVCRFDPETKTYEVLTETIPDIEMLGVTKDKLYALCVGTSAVAADTEISLSEIDPQTGAIDKVTFGKFLPTTTQDIGWSDYGTLVYDPQSDRLLTTPRIYDGENEDFHLLAFDMATQKAVLGERLATDNVNYLFRKGNDICAVYERVANYGTANESAVTDLYTVDPTAMTLGNKIGGDIADSWFNWNYDAATERMYGLSEEDWETETYSIGVYDWKAGSFKKLSESVQVQSIVLVE
ncbi:MAG: IPT/TIG domain-containing protein [Rikenellaceae bacterium]|nr:IPT/TIG domain-containing protein [uncultured Alistipes sp.]MDO5385527.1 IPT/TIG domain-containing protein [Rikenellaceae bacterium]